MYFLEIWLQIVGIVLQYGMWVVPVMIAESQYPEFLRPILKFNPMYYIVEGYRMFLSDRLVFWEDPMMTLYFWVVDYFIIFNR